jgi:PAS domain S-box-containing protein
MDTKSLNLLIVEDSVDDTVLLVRELKRAGYNINYERVETPDAFLNALDSKEWNLVISDHSMPQFNSLSALELLQKREIDIPFLIVSGAIGEESAVAAMKAGAHDYFIKGRTARLIPAIERELREAEERRLRKAAEEDLRQSEERFMKAFEANPLAIAIIRLSNHCVVDVNNSFLSLFGFTLDEVVDRNIHDLGIWYEEDYAILTHVIEQNRPIHHIEMTLRTKDQETYEILVAADHIKLSGEPCMLAMLHDITERQRAQEALLEQERLRVALAKEHELAEFRTRFMTMASHEFRTPMTVILSSSEILDEYFEQIAPEKRKEYLHNIKTQIRHLRGMLSEIELILKAETAFLEVQPEPMDIAEFFRGIINEMETSIGISHHLFFNVHNEPRTAMADERLMRIIFTNLLSNAAKFSPKGSDLNIELYFFAHEYVLRVQDSGIGIPDEDQKYLFKPFFRAGNTGAIGGTGIGLNLVKYCVEAHDGTIKFKSKIGQGTTFMLHFPYEREP